MATSGGLNISGLKNLTPKASSFNKLLSDLLKSKRRIDSENSAKSADGTITFNLQMMLLDDDDEPEVQFPAIATITPISSEDTTKIKLNLKLPSKTYNTDKQLVDVDTSAYQDMVNSKKQVASACWKCFDAMKYDMKKFASWFAVNPDEFNFNDESGQNIRQYIHKIPFTYVDASGHQKDLEFKMAAIPTDDSKERVNISFEYPDPENLEASRWLVANNKYKYVRNKQEDIVKKCQDFLKDAYNVDTLDAVPQNLTANAKLRITLQQVESATGTDIYLKNVMASYDPTLALDDVNTLLDDPQFLETLPSDEPVSYEVVPGEDDITLNLIDTNLSDAYQIDCRLEGYNAILDAAYCLSLTTQYLSYAASGIYMDKVQNYASNYSWSLNDIIDTVSKLVVEENLVLENPLCRIQRVVPTLEVTNFTNVTWKDFTLEMLRGIKRLSDALELYICNYSADIQNQMQTWIRRWKQEVDYVLFRSNQAESGAVEPMLSVPNI